MEQNNISRLVFKVAHTGGSGSCFYLRSHDLFVTNCHVVEGCRDVAVHDSGRNPYPARVVLVNPALDLALLAAEGDFSSLPALSLADGTALATGHRVRVAGYPFGMPFTLTEGTVSSSRQLMDGKYYVQIDAAVNPGNSGGPIVNDAGDVVGITVSKLSEADNMGFGICVGSLTRLLESVGQLDRSTFSVQCDSCDSLISDEVDYCPSCGERLPEGIFRRRELSALSRFCETAIGRMGINPVLARVRHEAWQFHKGSSEIRMFVFDDDYLFVVSPINLLPKKNVGPVLEYMLDTDLTPYKLGIEGRQIYLCYRIHLTDLTPGSEQRILDELVGFACKADEMDNMMVERFGCEFSAYTKQSEI